MLQCSQAPTRVEPRGYWLCKAYGDRLKQVIGRTELWNLGQSLNEQFLSFVVIHDKEEANFPPMPSPPMASIFSISPFPPPSPHSILLSPPHVEKSAISTHCILLPDCSRWTDWTHHDDVWYLLHWKHLQICLHLLHGTHLKLALYLVDTIFTFSQVFSPSSFW